MAIKKQTKDSPQEPKKSDESEKLVSLAEIASILRMSPIQVRKMAQSRQIPAVKVEGEWRFNKELVRQAVHKRSRGKLR